jgi:hypothetical protein
VPALEARGPEFKHQSYQKKKKSGGWGVTPVAHTCNPNYSGDRDQEDLGLKPAPANSSPDPILKGNITKKGWWSDSRP